MPRSTNPNASIGAARNFTPMTPPTYREALMIILREPRSVEAILSHFAPADQLNAIGALHELCVSGVIRWDEPRQWGSSGGAGRYSLVSREVASPCTLLCEVCNRVTDQTGWCDHGMGWTPEVAK